MTQEELRQQQLVQQLALGAAGVVAYLALVYCMGCVVLIFWSITFVVYFYVAIYVALAALVVGAIVLALFVPTTGATVTGHSWERTIDEEVAVVQRGGLRWSVVGTARAHGDNNLAKWPAVANDRCKTKGCRRPGRTTETYTVHVAVPDGPMLNCQVDQTTWGRAYRNKRLVVPFGALPTCKVLGLG